MTGDLIEWTPGDRVPVEIVADPAGNVARRGLGVEIAGENRSFTEAHLTQGIGSAGLGHLTTDPKHYDENATYTAGDSVGRATVLMHSNGDLLEPEDAYTPTVGDEVSWTAGGQITAYDGAATDARSSPLGVVFATGTRDFGSVGKAVVARFD